MAGYVARLVLIKAEIMTVVYKQLCTIESNLKVAPSIQRHRNASFKTMRVKGLFLKAVCCWVRIREHVDLVFVAFLSASYISLQHPVTKTGHVVETVMFSHHATNAHSFSTADELVGLMNTDGLPTLYSCLKGRTDSLASHVLSFAERCELSTAVVGGICGVLREAH